MSASKLLQETTHIVTAPDSYFKDQQKYTLFTSSYAQKMSKDEKLMLSVNNKLLKNN